MGTEVDTADVTVHVAVPGSLIVVSAELREGGVVVTGEAKAGTLHNLGGEEIKVDAQTGGNTNVHPGADGSLGRADTTFVLLGIPVEHMPGAPVSRNGVT